MARIFGLFCPYHKNEIMDSDEPEYNELPSYPRVFRRVRKYDNKNDQLSGFANVMCPASQMFECNEEELEETLKDLNAKFDDEKWLEVNVYPYI